MKMQPKPILAVASGAFLLFGVLAQSAHAQSVQLNEDYTGELELTGGSGPAQIAVGYEVTEGTPGVYTYTYTISDPGTPLSELSVDFNTTGTQTGETGSTTPAGNYYGYQATGSSVSWYFSIPSTGSATLSFQSPDAPTLGNADALDNASSWVATSAPPEGEDLAVPTVVPEPTTTPLIALSGLVLLAFRPSMLGRKV